MSDVRYVKFHFKMTGTWKIQKIQIISTGDTLNLTIYQHHNDDDDAKFWIILAFNYASYANFSSVSFKELNVNLTPKQFC